MIAILTTPAIAGIALFRALKVRSNTISFTIYVRFVLDPMGSDAKNTLVSKKCGKMSFNSVNNFGQVNAPLPTGFTPVPVVASVRAIIRPLCFHCLRKVK